MKIRLLIAAVAVLLASLSPAAAQLVQFSPAVTLGQNTFGAIQIINRNTAAAPSPQIAGTTHQLVQADSVANVLEMDSWTQNNSILGYGANGSNGSQSAAASGRAFLQLLGYGYDGTSVIPNAVLISAKTSELWDASHHGTDIAFRITTTGSTSTVTPLLLHANSGGTSFWIMGATAANTVPALKQVGTGFVARLGDDSADAAFSSGTYTTSGQIIAASMTQTATAQSGTVCWAAAGLTYDATLGCLASLPELKNIQGRIQVSLADIEKLRPIWFSWKNATPEWKGGDHGVQPGFNAREVVALPNGVGEKLTANGPDGKLRGVRYAQLTAYLQAEIIALKAANDNLAARLARLERRH